MKHLCWITNLSKYASKAVENNHQNLNDSKQGLFQNTPRVGQTCLLIAGLDLKSDLQKGRTHETQVYDICIIIFLFIYMYLCIFIFMYIYIHILDGPDASR